MSYADLYEYNLSIFCLRAWENTYELYFRHDILYKEKNNVIQCVCIIVSIPMQNTELFWVPRFVLSVRRGYGRSRGNNYACKTDSD